MENIEGLVHVPSNRPLSTERVAAYLELREWQFTEAGKGDLAGAWNGNTFHFMVTGRNDEILQVRGQWQHTLDASETGRIAGITNAWNLERFWPKTFWRSAEGTVSVFVDVSTDLEFGAADDQLAQHIECGLQSGLQFFQVLDHQFPEISGVERKETPTPDEA
ncbi:putative sensory transduction regulator [Sediminihabitans luteus]|uniref:Putative sensory transduction regulator n=1 Tax=Sediminihabitans luteus TaxID=1138585 RepID=A0A2M9CZH4_9CELL|nr:YbjN domain-containing protein [Sediminihabitans luteus]PJJ77346.1 putative sensory transduction regulator [Sediminihabitans luteus]GII98797.1 hypothetical protein Slu03_11750 [Sediminihabitans luteus]